MNTGNFFELCIEVADENIREVLIAQLAEMGYEGFEEMDDTLKAYIEEVNFSENKLNNIFSQQQLKYSKSVINKQNWNQVWESNFEPVRVDDFVGIRANFHPPFDKVTYEIVITPKMSFGTGHHATTYLVMQLMRELNFPAKSVFDFGTGTGILAILAEKLGAGKITAVDNDDWCIENASENIEINHCTHVEIEKADKFRGNIKFDIILANINRNILLDNMVDISAAIASGGDIILSGLLADDEKVILTACLQNGLQHVKTVERNGWIAIRLYMN